MITIDDPADPRVAAFASLQARGNVRGDTIIVESELAVRRLLQHGVPTRAVLVVDRRAASLEGADGVDVFVCTQQVLDAIVGFSVRRGAFAIAERPITPPEALIQK